MESVQKITVEVPEELLAKAREATGEGVTATVRLGLRLLAAGPAYARLRSLRGRVRFSKSAAALRVDRS